MNSNELTEFLKLSANIDDVRKMGIAALKAKGVEVSDNDSIEDIVKSVEMIETKQPIDSTLSETSDNPVQNKVIAQKVNELSNRIDNIATLPQGSTTADAELIDIRLGADGKIYANAGTAVRNQVSALKQDLVELQRKFVEINKINLDDAEDNVFFFSNNGHIETYSNSAFKAITIDVSNVSKIKVSAKMYNNYKVGFFVDSSGYLLSYFGFSSTELVDIEDVIIDVPNNATMLKFTICKAYISNYSLHTIIEKPLNNYDETIEDIYERLNTIKPFNNYKYPYIKNGKVLCNKATDTYTAYYAGVDCSTDINVVSCKWIWEIGTKTGVLALITNPNGADKITDITDLSVHLVLDNNHVAVDILGGKFGQYYYQNIINEQFETPMSLDGVTEHTVTLNVIPDSNRIEVYIDDTVSFAGTFTPDSNISSLSECIGQYAIFEHFTTTDRDTVSMPMFTNFYCRDINNDVRVYDSFDRENGQLVNTPQGLPYHLISTSHNKG